MVQSRARALNTRVQVKEFGDFFGATDVLPAVNVSAAEQYSLQGLDSLGGSVADIEVLEQGIKCWTESSVDDMLQ